MTGTVVLRPVREADAEGIWRLLAPAEAEVIGMASLPASAEGAELICRDSAETVAALATGSFEMAGGCQRRLLFLAEDGGGTPLGVTGVTFKQSVPNLAVQVTTSDDGQGLTMSSSSAPWTRTELDSTFLGPGSRGRRLGTLLSRGRFMFLHLVGKQIPPTIASHLRGRFDDDGSAPFWRCFGAHFAPQWATSTEAEVALTRDPSLLDGLADHMLPVTALVLESLGPVNAASLPAFHLLRAEGLRPNGMYDPIDGGPTLVADIADTVTGRLRIHGRARIGEPGPVDALVSITSRDGFRATRADLGLDRTGLITIDEAAATAIGAGPDTLLAAVPLDPAPAYRPAPIPR